MLFVAVLLLCALSAVVFAAPTPQGIDDATIAKVRAVGLQISTHSWELGTLTEALLELEFPELSVYGSDPFPPSNDIYGDKFTESEVVQIATRIVNNRPTDSPALIKDGAAGDPASLGTAVTLTGLLSENKTDGQRFLDAAQSQLNHLLNDVPRTPDGAISHRESEVQLWDDNMYMSPPFIAYSAAIAGGLDETRLLHEAYQQIKVYRSYMADDSGLWQHILLGTQIAHDTTHWGTGNAWVVSGLMRVLQTMRKSSQADDFIAEQHEIADFVDEVLTAAWKFQGANGTLFNVVDRPDIEFADSCTTAMVAAATYRLAAITGDDSHIPNADKALQLIKQSIDDNGFLTQVVNPLSFHKTGTQSPEGQSFVLLLHSAWRDYYARQ